ncbi:MAG: hypothetical protein H6737_20510 [Alphaproteobacteria bacterium]|nr:hypothetical protein [Alphaproteobacteria bacterium]
MAAGTAILAVTLRGYSRAEGDAVRMAGLVARVHQLLAVHAGTEGGVPCPSGTDVGLARFDGALPALRAALALVREVEAARDAHGHAHHGLLALGIDRGDVLLAPDGRVLGVPVARALRLAVLGEDRGELLVSAAAREGLELPPGVGGHAGRREQAERLGFGFHHIVDYE